MANTVQTLKLTDLLVNHENFRFDPTSGQKPAIDAMIQNQKDKLFNLAEDIVANGLNPGELLHVAFDKENKKYYILEGNRRVITLKILNNPNLVDSDSYPSLKKKFKALQEENKERIEKISSEINCVVYDEPTDADRWVKLKHTGENEGVGTVSWNTQQKRRFDERYGIKSEIAMQALKLLAKSPYVPDEIKKDLGKITITNLDRLLSDPDVRDALGVEINNGNLQSEIEEKEVMKGLVHVAKDLLDPKFSVKKIYHKDDRKRYIKGFPVSSKPNLHAKASPWAFTDSGSATSKPPRKPKPNPKDRNRLIPKSCVLIINNPKVNAIYDELKRLKVNDFPNAVAVSFRVFVELSLDCYTESNKLSITKESSLGHKVEAVAKHLEEKKLADKHICKGIRNGIHNTNSLLGIETWHAYVHNNKFSPIPRDLITIWDNIQPFIQLLWENTK